MTARNCPKVVGLIAVLLACAGARQDAHTADPSGLREYAKETLNVTDYRLASADLNGDGNVEFLLYATNWVWCGSGGCTLFIVAHGDRGYRLVSRTTIVRLPVRLLPNIHNGWRDLGVIVRGGGIARAYEARLPFDGRKYAENPSMPPAEKLAGDRGMILIAEESFRDQSKR